METQVSDHLNHHESAVADRVELGSAGTPLLNRFVALCVLGLGGSALLAFTADDGVRRFYFAYLLSYLFFLSLALGALFFVLIQHATRAGWSVNVRRVAEALAGTLPLLSVLAIPILISVALHKGDLYSWAGGHIESEKVLGKRAWLNPGFFIARVVGYLAIWSWIATGYLRKSTRQDQSRDAHLTTRMQSASYPLLVIYGLTVTFAAFDLIMSLDPLWYSTIFGVYFFSGSAVAGFAAIILILMLLQRAGYLTRSVTREHYHDLGKFLFGFTFFWGYIAFSQYMLIWYGSIPEEVEWFRRRGATTVPGDMNGWTIVSLILLFCNFLIPFAGLLSRHVKRTSGSLAFWAVWLLLFHWVDLGWMVLPQLSENVSAPLMELLTFAGLAGLFVAAMIRTLSRHKLLAVGDPRFGESMAFQNI
jgi:hypothetical protein